MTRELWGLVIAAIGVFFLICGWIRSDFFLYRVFVARSRMLWGKHVHVFYRTVGVALILFGLLLALAYI